MKPLLIPESIPTSILRTKEGGAITVVQQQGGPQYTDLCSQVTPSILWTQCYVDYNPKLHTRIQPPGKPQQVLLNSQIAGQHYSQNPLIPYQICPWLTNAPGKTNKTLLPAYHAAFLQIRPLVHLAKDCLHCQATAALKGAGRGGSFLGPPGD